MRVLIRDNLRVATCVGFGPRFQHCTGQVYKCGPNSGVFFQITCTDRIDLAVSGYSYTFGTVNEARARGDFDVLTKRARRARRLDIGDDASAGLKALGDAVARILRYATPNYAERED